MDQNKKKKKLKKTKSKVKKETNNEQEEEWRKLAQKTAKKGLDVFLEELNDENIKWTETKTKGDINIWKRKVEGIKMDRVKMELWVPNITPKKLFKLFYVEEERMRYDTQFKRAYTLKHFQPFEENEQLVCDFEQTKSLLGGSVSSRYMVDCRIIKNLENGAVLCGTNSLDDETKVGIKQLQVKGVRAFNYPSGFLMTPITRSQWVEHIKISPSKSKKRKKLTIGTGDPDQVVATLVEMIICSDIGGKFPKKVINKFVSTIMLQSFGELIDFINGPWRQIKKKEKKKKKLQKKEN
ncbi:hypothetical protein M0813_14105 [Anaeramoeba flamelloides]|uniref:START domain-containing protein n=1 Tax=Anaeramoeba flamelloides TaxID=1746091 RepID=A0ABQ8Z6R4_9EUKA|nr:hypothetical protein M0813_14105 [Anaeramoeba flamelloides]